MSVNATSLPEDPCSARRSVVQCIEGEARLRGGPRRSLLDGTLWVQGRAWQGVCRATYCHCRTRTMGAVRARAGGDTGAPGAATRHRPRGSRRRAGDAGLGRLRHNAAGLPAPQQSLRAAHPVSVRGGVVSAPLRAQSVRLGNGNGLPVGRRPVCAGFGGRADRAPSLPASPFDGRVPPVVLSRATGRRAAKCARHASSDVGDRFGREARWT